MTGSMARGVPRRDEAGFTLVTTLGLLLLATLLIVVMLSVTMNTSTLVQRQAEDARELRAADGAISAATGFLRDTPPEEVDAQRPCADDNTPPLPPGAEMLPSDVQVDGMSVRVACEELEGSGEVVPLSESGTVTVLSDGDTSQRPDGTWPTAEETYWGGAPWTTGCPLGTTGVGCFPWRDAYTSGPMSLIEPAGRPNVNAWPSMLYAGSTSLKIGGDLRLRAASMGVRDPGTLGAALSVSGDYTQGLPALGSAYYGACGVLADNGPNVYPTMRANVGGSMACNDPTARALTADNAAIPSSVEWTPTLLRSEARTLGACPATTLVTIVPGAYNASETAKLNAWLTEGNCDSKTFYFGPGNYWFDVNDAGNANALYFRDSTSNVVFGMPKHWSIGNDDGAEAEDFPEACDPRAAGASVTLSARTTIRHDKGRVAMCGPSRGVPAIWQDEAPGDTDHVLSPATATSSTLSGGGIAKSGTWGCPFFTWDWPWNWPRASCKRDVSVTYSGFSGGDDPGPGPLTSVILKVVGSHSRANDGPAYTQFDVSVPAVNRPGKPTIPAFTCRARYFRIPQRTNEPLTYDLLARPSAQGGDTGASENSCWDRFSDRAQLRVATITATFHLDTHERVLYNDLENTQTCLYAGFFSGCEYSFSINNLQIIEGRTFSPTTATSPDSTMSSPANVVNWPNGSRPSGENVGRIRLSGLKSPYDPPLPTEELDAAGLLLTSLSYYGNHDDAYTNVVVRKADLTAICGAGFKRIGANGHTRYLDLMTTDTNQASTLSGYSRCSSALTSAMQLENAVIDIEVKAKCSSIIPGLICGWGFVNAWIELTHASVITVSSFEEPAPAGRPVMRVTVNDDAGAGDDALFNVFGTVSLPRTALDVFWKGPAPTRAIVEGDDLVVAAIGSFGTGADHEVGVLCCGPVKLKDRKVQLRAIVDVPGEGERLRSEATVTIHDEDESAGTYSAGSRVTTDDYRICNTADVDDPVGCGHTSP